MENIRHLEHISLRAWASLETEAYDGWLLRYAKGYTGRANSVQALDNSSLPLMQKIDYCENWYAQRNLPAIFRLTSAMQPPELDDVLDERNYERYNETLVQVSPLSNLSPVQSANFHFDSSVSDEWLEAWGTWNNVPEQHIAIAKMMLSDDSTHACFAWIDNTAVGLAICEDNYVGLFDIVVDPHQRGQGLGFSLVNSLLAWGKSQGAKMAYLQVVANNVPALALYDKLGFKTHHHYWYRRQTQAIK